LQENHYYPFGLNQEGKWLNNAALPDTKYQYNGKELNEDLGLNWYAYGFRFFAPEIARFVSVDPLADKFPFLTTYQYASNDPIKNIDLDGLEGVRYDIISTNGKGKLETTTYIEMSLHVGISKTNSVSYKESDLPAISKNLEKQYSGKKIDGKMVEFKFDVKTFDLDKTTLKDYSKELRKSASVETNTTRGFNDANGNPVMKTSITGAAIALDGNVTKEQGSTTLNGISINPNAENMRHTEAHEVGHFFLIGSPSQPGTHKEHDNLGGIFKYKQVDGDGNTVSPVESVSKSNIQTILGNIPQKKQ
jgi:RHS repeat-associated protein